MSNSLCQVLKLIINDYFGEKSSAIISFILLYGSASLIQIILHFRKNHTIKPPELKHLISILIHHNVITFKEANHHTLYEVYPNAILSLIKSPRYLCYIKLKYGVIAYQCVEEILIHGRLDLISIVSLVNKSVSSPNNVYTIKDILYKLISSQILRRTPWLNSAIQDNCCVPSFIYNESFAYNLPTDFDFKTEWERHQIQVASAQDFGSPQPSAKRLKVDPTGTVPIYWCLNVEHLDRLLLGDMMGQALESRYLTPLLPLFLSQGRGVYGHHPQERWIPSLANSVFSASGFLNSAGFGAPPLPPTFELSLNDVMADVPKSVGPEWRAERDLRLSRLDYLCDMDTCTWLRKVGEGAGGTFSFDVRACVTSMLDETVYALLRHRFGPKAARIYRLVNGKRYVEQKRIEECSMVSSKVAKELLYILMAAGFVQNLEISKAPDYAPSRTFYLFGVNEETVARLLLECCLKTYSNLITRRSRETSDGDRIYDKRDKIDAIVAALLADESGVDYGPQVAELRGSVTDHERQRMEQLDAAADKLDSAMLGLDETITLITAYLDLRAVR